MKHKGITKQRSTIKNTRPQSIDIQHPKIKSKGKSKINVESYCKYQNSIYICNAIKQDTLISRETANQMITEVNSNERVFLVRSELFIGLSDVFCNVKDLKKVIEAVEENGNTAKVYHFWDGKLKVCPKKLYIEMIKDNAQSKSKTL